MKKVISFLLCVVMIVCSITFYAKPSEVSVDAATSKIHSSDFLKANGKVLKNNYGNGNTVYLRGTNAGGLSVQEFWMCPTSYSGNVNDQMDIWTVLTNRFGADKAKTLVKHYIDTYWQEADFDKCASLGINCIRLPLWYRDFVDANNNWYSNPFEWVDWFVEQAGARGIYVILDMHGAYGSQNGSDHSGIDGGNAKEAASEFFFGSNAASNQQKYYDMWVKIAEHYKGNPIVAGYDLLNEPYCTYRYSSSYSEDYLHSLLWDIYSNVYTKIRAVDPDHLIIMEATWDSWDLPNPTDRGWSNVMYEYHQYEYSNYSNEDNKQITSLQNKINNIFAMNYDVPSYMGEFNLFNSDAAWNEGLKMLNDNGLNWTTWTYKALTSNDNWGLYKYSADSVNIESDSYDSIYSKWSGVGTSYENTYITNVLKKYVPGTVEGSSVPDAVGRHEAEDALGYTQGSAGEAYSTQTSSNYSGGVAIGNLNTWNGDENARSYFTTNVNANYSGTYKMTIGYAGGIDGQPTQIDVRVNGGSWTTVSASYTGGWDQVKTVTLDVNLNVGVNTIDVTGARNVWYNQDQAWQWLNMDYFDLEYGNVVTTAAPTQAPTTTNNIPSGYTACMPNTATNVGQWNYLVCKDWVNSEAYYKGGSSLNDFSMYVVNSGSTKWGTQVFTNKINVTSGHTYSYSITLNSDKASGEVLLKDDTNLKDLQTKTLSVGDNVYSGTFTADSDQVNFIFDLGLLNAGTTVKVTSFSLTDVTPTTQAPTEAPTQAPTVAPTQAPTVAPTVAPTQASTVAPTTTKEQTGGAKPSAPIGLTYAGNDALPFYFAWQTVENSTYNFYVNDQQVATGITGIAYNCESQYFPTAGTYTISVTAVQNGVESDKTSITYNVTTGNVGTTAPQTTSTVEETTTRSFVEGGELLKNTVFDGSDYWIEYGVDDGAEYTNNANGSVSVKVPAYTGGNNWATQLKQTEITLTEGRWYKGTVTVTSDVARKFQLLVQSDGDYGGNWDVINQDTVFTVEAGVPYTHQIVFQANNIQNKYLYGLMMGFVDGIETTEANVTVSNVSLKEYSSEPETENITTEAPTTVAPTEAPTEAPTTKEPDKADEEYVKVEGYQISTTYEGFRVIGSVEPTINGRNVNKWGFVYALTNINGKATGVMDADMKVGSGNYYIASFDSTPAGTIEAKPGESSTATYFVRTMNFVNTSSKALTARYRVRAYAVLEDGTYIYGDIGELSVYDVADALYQNHLMNTLDGHKYLYDNILKSVKPSYEEIDFTWGNTIVGPGLVEK